MICLLAATSAAARAVVHGEGALPEPRAHDWPHADSADVLRPLADHPAHTGPGTFLILEAGSIVGECSWGGPPCDGEVLVSYGLAPSVRGRGVGTTAVAQLLVWTRDQGASRVRAEVRPDNVPSRLLLARLGFVAAAERDGHLQLTYEFGGSPSDLTP